MNRARLSVVLVVDPTAPGARRYAESAAHALRDVAALRLVPHDRVIGRDLRECDRLATFGPRTFEALPHLRELATQVRDKTIAMLFHDDVTAACTPKGLALLRRFCGRVAVDDRRWVPTLREHLLAPVHALPPDDPAALWTLLALTPGASDAVESHLRDALQWISRGNHEAAFGSAARALQKAPDQPGIVADVARLLVHLGQRDQAVLLCRHFLVQRPGSEPVERALRELGPSQEPTTPCR